MKTTSYQALSNKFSDVLKESQNIQVSFKAAVREKITRQAKIIDDKLTEDQIEEICNDPEVIHKETHIKHNIRALRGF